MANPSAALRQVVQSNLDLREQFESLLNEKRDVTSQLGKVLDENAALNLEIAKLRSQLASRLPSVLAAKEKLMKEEFDRKLQELTLEVRQERYRYRNAIGEVQKQIASCICGAKNRMQK